MLGKSIYHGLLVYYLREKSKLIKEKTGIEFIYDEDIEEVMKWSSSRIRQFFDKDVYIQGKPTDDKFISDLRACPWCHFNYGYVYNDYNCKWCGYGKRHGKCTSLCKESTYGKVRDIMLEKGLIAGSICMDKDIERLIIKVKELYNRISKEGFSYEDLCTLILN